ncbi:hypothetical protein F7R14_06370 [Pseudomonas lini]|uniref:Uncharacterized protein n=1 Tax=Pseudomonas lini TaxID=163011 RepID=A0A7V7TNM5_9PSED|nr:hypothetical protein F7R14_06370 [Pseudomonas lini]
MPRCPLRNAYVRPLGKGRQIKIKSQSNGNGNGNGKINSFASRLAHTWSGYIRGKTGRLTGRHRRQASSHRRSGHI